MKSILSCSLVAAVLVGLLGCSTTDPQDQTRQEQVGFLHPDDPDLIVNPYDPKGPPLRVRNLKSRDVDYAQGDVVLPDPNKPWERVIVPELDPVP